MSSIREQMIDAGRMLFERKLLDTAGGNISAREGDTIYVTARFSGPARHWQNRPEDIISGSFYDDNLLNHPLFSREGKAHIAIYRNFPEVGAIIHAHPFHVLAFCAASRPIEPVLEGTQKFGVIKVIPAASAHSAELAQNVVNELKGQEAAIKKHAAAVLLPRHGIIVAGKDLLAAVDALERIDTNAFCILAQKALL